MNYHLCKTRRGSNPDAVVNCNNSSSGPGGVSPASQSDLDRGKDSCRSPLSIQICPTTGGLFNMDIAAGETVEGLRRTVAKKLGVAQERISLLYKDRLLKSGTIKDNHLCEGSRVTLLPHVEAGLMSPHPEVSVMQALENLSESQVHDFLAGKSPLTLAMKFGKHVMFLQLQLSTVTPATKRVHPSSAKGNSNNNNTPTVNNPLKGRHPPRQSPNSLTVPLQNQMPNRTLQPNPPCQDHMLRVPSPSIPSIVTPPPSPKSPSQTTLSSPYTYPPTACQGASQQTMTPSKDAYDVTNTPPPSPCYLKKPIPLAPGVSGHSGTDAVQEVGDNQKSNPSSLRTSPQTPGTTGNSARTAQRVPILDNSSFAEAKRSLSMTLEQFSKKAAMERAKEMRQAGAVIDTMQRIGHGVYTGTFSGTLNPALQDTEGKPKKSINTIVHILNDLLGASHPRPCRSPAWARMPPRPATVNDGTGATKDKAGNEASRKHEEEGRVIRDKVELIQMKLEEKKRRRQARRKARSSPYPTSEGHVRSTKTDDVMTASGEASRCLKVPEVRVHHADEQPMEQDNVTPV